MKLSELKDADLRREIDERGGHATSSQMELQALQGEWLSRIIDRLSSNVDLLDKTVKEVGGDLGNLRNELRRYQASTEKHSRIMVALTIVLMVLTAAMLWRMFF